MKTEPSLSLISSVFNGDRHIEGFLFNITQLKRFDECELILVLPDSPGNELETISAYREKHPNIQVVILSYDPGIYETWNTAIRISRSPFISNANLDDIRAPGHLEAHLDIISSDPAIDLVSAATLVTRQINETWDHNSHYDTWYSSKPRVLTSADLFRVDIDESGASSVRPDNVPHAMPVWRRSLHDRFGYFDEVGFGSAADWEFWLRCLAGGAQFRHIQEPLCLYLEDQGSYERRQDDSEEKIQKILGMYYFGQR